MLKFLIFPWFNGKSTLVNDKQFWNVDSLTSVIDDEILTFWSDEPSLKANGSIDLTNSGIIILASIEHPSNADVLIVFLDDFVFN